MKGEPMGKLYQNKWAGYETYFTPCFPVRTRKNESDAIGGYEITNVDGKWILDTKVSGMEGVGRFVIGLAGDIKVIDSPELNEYIQDFYIKYLNRFIK